MQSVAYRPRLAEGRAAAPPAFRSARTTRGAFARPARTFPQPNGSLRRPQRPLCLVSRASAALPSLRRVGGVSRTQRVICQGVKNPSAGGITTFWGYSLDDLRGDLLAGCTVSVVLIPQAIAYALLAGLPPIYGLYCSLVPILVYALTTSSIHNCVGPFALVSLLVAQLIRGALGPDLTLPAYISAVMLLSFLTGVVQLAMAAARAGNVTTFLGESVVSGFTTGSAILIMSSQVKHCLGLKLAQDEPLFVLTQLLGGEWRNINPYTMAISAACIWAMVAIKDFNKKKLPNVVIPEQLLVLVCFTLLSWAVGLSEAPYNVRCLMHVDAKLPALQVPAFDLVTVRKLLEPAVMLAIVSYMITISLAQSLATKFKYAVDANQELFALGCSNVAGAFFQAYPCSGSLSRSAVCAASGGRTQLHGLVQFVVVLATTALFMPWLAPLPYPALAAVVIMALKTMINFRRGPRLFQMSRGDFFQWGVTLAATVLLGVQSGLALGMGSSMLWLVRQTCRPSWAVLGRLPRNSLTEQTLYQNVALYPAAKQLLGILIFRFDGPLHFANKDYFCEVLAKIRDERDVRCNPHERMEWWYVNLGFLSSKVNPDLFEEEKPKRSSTKRNNGMEVENVQVDDTVSSIPVLYLVLDCVSMLNMDAAGMAVFEDLLEDCQKRDPPINIMVSGYRARGDFRRALKSSGLIDKIGEENMFLSLHQAVEAAETGVQEYIAKDPMVLRDSLVI